MALSLQSLGKGLGKGKFNIFAKQLFSPKVRLEELASKNIAITTDNLAISFDSSGKPSVTVIGDYFKASKELADLVGKLQFEDLAKAEEMERAFYSAKSYDESYLFRTADFLEKKLESVHPMRALFENEWERAKEEAALMLANQLANVFRIYSAKGERKLFSEFADEIKAVYKDVALKAKEIAVKELARQDVKLSREFEKGFDEVGRKKRNKKILYGSSFAAFCFLPTVAYALQSSLNHNAPALKDFNNLAPVAASMMLMPALRAYGESLDAEEKNKKSRRKRWLYGLVGGAAGILLGTLAWNELINKPEQERKPYKEAGLSKEQADSFIKNYPQQNGNSTWVSFAKAWVEDQSLADSAFKTFKDLNKTLEYLSLSNNKQLLSSALNAYG
ncbi:MAG: hypothetical protein QXU74_00625, partial [Candidatus Aenigmatarchaeota archaeon]